MGIKKRIYFLDYIRGFLIIAVVLQHTLYDLDAIFGVSMPFLWMDISWFVRDIGVVLFIGISGFCANLSASNLGRGIRALIVAMGITVVTYSFLYSQRISFGIIHLLGVCMILYGLLENVIKRINPYVLTAVGVILFMIFFGLPNGYIGFGSIIKLQLPRWIYTWEFLFPLGIAYQGFFSADYYPLIPWMFMFFAGSGLGRIVLKKDLPDWWYKNPIPSLGWIGRNTMVIYIVHQPLVYGILWIIFDKMMKN